MNKLFWGVKWIQNKCKAHWKVEEMKNSGSEKIKLQCFAKDKKSINGNFLAYIGLLKDQFIYIGNNYLSNVIYHFPQNYFGIE